MENMNNNNLNGLVSKEERNRIKNEARFLKSMLLIWNGFLEIFHNCLKACIAAVYIIVAVAIWRNREHLIDFLYSGDSTILSTVYHWLITLGIFILVPLIFIIMLRIFGTVFYYSNKFVNACISARIFTGAGKPPWLLRKYKDKKDRIFTIWEVFLNGNTETNFREKQEEMESELGVKIHNFKPEGTRKLLLYTTPEITSESKKINRDDLNY